MTPPPSQDGSSSGDDPENHGPDAGTTADSADIAALLSSSTSPSVGMTMATLAVAASIGAPRTDENNDVRESGVPTDTDGDCESGAPTETDGDRESGAPTDNNGDRESGAPTNTRGPTRTHTCPIELTSSDVNGSRGLSSMPCTSPCGESDAQGDRHATQQSWCLSHARIIGAC